MRLALLCTCAVLASACGIQLSQPDGGRLRLNCTNSLVTVPVKVLDREGKGLEGASVSATNLSDGRIQTGTTNGSGVFAVTEEVGPGVVRVTAGYNDLVSPQADATFTCGECDCAVSPRAITLQLQ